MPKEVLRLIRANEPPTEESQYCEALETRVTELEDELSTTTKLFERGERILTSVFDERDRYRDALGRLRSLGNDPDNAPMPMHRVMQIVHEALNPQLSKRKNHEAIR